MSQRQTRPLLASHVSCVESWTRGPAAWCNGDGDCTSPKSEYIRILASSASSQNGIHSLRGTLASLPRLAFSRQIPSFPASRRITNLPAPHHTDERSIQDLCLLGEANHSHDLLQHTQLRAFNRRFLNVARLVSAAYLHGLSLPTVTAGAAIHRAPALLCLRDYCVAARSSFSSHQKKCRKLYLYLPMDSGGPRPRIGG